jgi:hypothetical protein
MSAFRHEIIIRRDSRDEQTFAVIAWNGAHPDLFFQALRSALAEWQQTPDGQGAWEKSSHDFNIGDLCNAHLARNPLRSILVRHDIHGLEIDVYSCDFSMPWWTFDTHLMDPIEEDA